MSHIKRGGGLPGTLWRATGQWEILKQKYEYAGIYLYLYSIPFMVNLRSLYFLFLFSEKGKVVNELN